MNSGSITFAECVIIQRDLVFISAQVTELNAQGVEHTKVLRWKDGAFAHFMIDWATTALAATTAPLTLLSLGIFGDIHVFQGATRAREHIPGPDHLGPLRDMRLIAGDYYATGMQRQVYKRRGEQDWVSIADALCAHETIKGFNSIDGYSAHELYAAGLDGELWRFDGQHWQLIELPTSVALHCVHCSDNGLVYVVGQRGVVLVGRRDQWRMVELGDLREELWGVQRFNDQLFVASSKAVYYVHDGQLEQAAIGAEGVGASSYLTANDGVLWSVGARHLAYTFDGKSWITLDYDDPSC